MTTAKRNGLLAGGLWLIDSTKSIDRYPEAGRLATILEVTPSNGGGAFNVLVDLAKLQADFPLSGVGLIGDDVAADWILERCRHFGIVTEALQRCADQPTAGTDVMTERGSGQRTFFYHPGANRELSSQHFPLSSSPARILYLGYPGLLPRLDALQPDSGRTGVADLLERAHHAGFITAVDLVSAETNDWASIASALPWIDLLFINEWEAAHLLRRSPLPEKSLSATSLAEMGRQLIDHGVRRAAMVHCSQGAVCVPKEGSSLQLGAVRVPADELLGTCGAGDAFTAGFLLSYHRGQSWNDCLTLATCAAAMCLNDLRSSEGIGPAADCLAYGRRHGFREFS